MKYMIFLISIILLLTFCIQKGSEVEVTLVNWTQALIETTNQWAPVQIEYEIKNISDSDIESYTVYGRLRCVCGAQFRDSAVGNDLQIDESRTGFFSINTLGKKAEEVKIYDWQTN